MNTLPLRSMLAALESGSRPKGGVSGILNGVPSLGGEHLARDGGFNFEKIKYVPERFADSMSRGHLEIGDVLVVKDGATTGKTALVRPDFPHARAVINEHVFRLKLKDEHVPAYVFYFLLSQTGQQQILSDFRGAAQGGISQGFVDKVSIPARNRDQQRRIVEEIEKQFTRLDIGIAALRHMQNNLKRYRVGVLKAACEGRLVPTESELAKQQPSKRGSNPCEEATPDFESGETLLARVLKRRRAMWNGRGTYKEPPPAETEALSAPPLGWTWSSLAQLATHITDGTHKTPTYVESGVPFLSAKDINGFKVSFDECRYIPRSEHEKLSKRCSTRSGNVLITKSGTIGRVAVVRTKREFSLFESVANVPVVDPVNSDYLGYAAFVGIAGVFGANNQKGVAVRHLHLEDLRRVPIPLPPVAEQTRIVAEVERRLSVVEELETVVNANLQRATRLRQSILKCAFSGSHPQ